MENIFLEHNWLAISSFLFLELRKKQHYLSDYSKIMLLFTVTIKYSRELNAINEAQSRLYAALKELDND